MHLVELVVLNFYFDLVLRFYFLKWNYYFQPVNENLTNSSCHFRKHKSVFLQTLHQASVPSNVTLLYFFSSNIIYFDQKERIKVQIFEIFECSYQNLLNSSDQFWTSQFLFKFCIFFIVIISDSPVSFKLIHFLLGIKVPHTSSNFESQLSSALVKICQIPHVIFQTKSQFFFKVCITL